MFIHDSDEMHVSRYIFMPTVFLQDEVTMECTWTKPGMLTRLPDYKRNPGLNTMLFGISVYFNLELILARINQALKSKWNKTDERTLLMCTKDGNLSAELFSSLSTLSSYWLLCGPPCHLLRRRGNAVCAISLAPNSKHLSLSEALKRMWLKQIKES